MTLVLVLVGAVVPVFGAAKDQPGELGLPMASPESAGMSSERLERLSAALHGYVDRGELAGTVALPRRSCRALPPYAPAEVDLRIPMTQIRPYTHLNIRQDTQTLAYQAIVE